MATITVMQLQITPPSGTPATATIAYQYILSCSKAECEAGSEFRVSADLIGDDVLFDDELGTFDKHTIDAPSIETRSTTVVRTFSVAAKLLDEDIGGDEIKVRVVARFESPDGRISTATGMSYPVSGEWGE